MNTISLLQLIANRQTNIQLIPLLVKFLFFLSDFCFVFCLHFSLDKTTWIDILPCPCSYFELSLKSFAKHQRRFVSTSICCRSATSLSSLACFSSSALIFSNLAFSSSLSLSAASRSLRSLSASLCFSASMSIPCIDQNVKGAMSRNEACWRC